jgi:hypothetical protein
MMERGFPQYPVREARRLFHQMLIIDETEGEKMEKRRVLSSGV